MSYQLNVVVNPIIEKTIQKIMRNFIKKSVKSYVGLDFEFNKVSKDYKDIALMQISLSLDGTIVSDIIILHPPSLESKTLKILHKLLTTSRSIKIIHGGEALDLPYVYKQLFSTKKQISKFAKYFYDTKLICDYMRVIKDKNQGDKNCSIYDVLIANKVIDKTTYDMLSVIDEKKSLEDIDIHNLSKELLQYSIYDVLFLPKLMQTYLNYHQKNAYELIREIYGIITISKNGLDVADEFSYGCPEIYPELAIYVNTFNIKKVNNKPYNVIWKYFTKKILISYVANMYEINYFRKFIKNITKLIIYMIYSNDEKLKEYYKKLSMHYKYLRKCVLEPYYTFIVNRYGKLK